jgi:hypothetical protein
MGKVLSEARVPAVEPLSRVTTDCKREGEEQEKRTGVDERRQQIQTTKRERKQREEREERDRHCL